MLGPKILGWGPDLLCRVVDFECRGPNSFAESVVGAPRLICRGPELLCLGPHLCLDPEILM